MSSTTTKKASAAKRSSQTAEHPPFVDMISVSTYIRGTWVLQYSAQASSIRVCALHGAHNVLDAYQFCCAGCCFGSQSPKSPLFQSNVLVDLGLLERGPRLLAL